jgi:hypothetical protein
MVESFGMVEGHGTLEGPGMDGKTLQDPKQELFKDKMAVPMGAQKVGE